MITAFEYAGETVTVDLTPLGDGRMRAVIGARVYTVGVTTLPDGGVTLDLDGARHTVYSALQGTDRLVALDGAVYTLASPETRTGKQRTAAASGALVAGMPGVVREVLVRAGDSVTRGAAVVVLEAMKMEIRVAAPHAGVVTRLHVAVGDVVTRGQLLAEVSAEQAGM
ncbi:MAG: biotin/lipoyl-containing protein [Chloroflexota bacterium]|nr:biotin/lipoyl-containing protein [Chloroflexota bacterium]